MLIDPRRGASGLRRGWLDRRTALAAALSLLGAGSALPACTSRTARHVTPVALVSPYPGPSEVVLAVAPLRNESGVSLVDELALSDTLVNELQQASGLTVLPVNRTLAAMRALKLQGINSPSEALALARALGADGVIVGSVSAWDPYDPPTIGMSLAIFGQGPLLRAAPQNTVDPDALRSARTEAPAGGPVATPGLLSALSETLDASNGTTRQAIRAYAAGRFDPQSALGWQRYTASMGQYTKFVCYEMSRKLFDAERARIQLMEPPAPAASDSASPR
jgi:hypothetical protein